MRLFGDSFLLTDYYLSNCVSLTRFSSFFNKPILTFLTSEEPVLPEFDTIFRSYLNESEASARKLKSVRQMMKSLKDTIKNDKERLKIKQMLNESDHNYNYRKKEMPLFESIGKMDPDAILEKYVILSHLISHDIRFHMEAGVNPFKPTIFNEVLGKKYPDLPSITAKFLELNEKYKPVLHKIQNLFIRKIREDNEGGRSELISMKEQEEITNYRLGKGVVDFTVGVFNRLKQQNLVMAMLYYQIHQNIKKKLSQEGIPQSDVLLHLKNIEKGFYTKNNLQTLLRLISEANADLRLVKLPSYYKKTFPQIKDKYVSDIVGSLKKIVDFISKENYTVYKDESERERRFKFFIESEKIPTSTLESLFRSKKDFDKPIFDYMSPEEKKAFTIIYAPEDADEKHPEFPNLESLESKTSEELEAMGFKPIETVEFEVDPSGRILNSDLDDEKREKIQNTIKEFMFKEKKDKGKKEV